MHKNVKRELSLFYFRNPLIVFLLERLRFGYYHIAFERHQPTPEGGRYLHLNGCAVFLSLLPYLCFLSELVID